MKKINFHNIVWKEEKYFVSKCLEVEVSSYGNTEKEAINNLQEALELYYEDQPLQKKQIISKVSINSIELSHA